MGGLGVSSVMVNPNTHSVYAGTKEGKVFKIASADGVTAVDQTTALPTEFAMDQNYPNPFNPTTTIQFAIPEAGRYVLKVYNILGQEVTTLVNEEMGAGIHKVTFNANNLASGLYIYRLSGNNVNITKKMMLMK